jgi:hypothetical protein
LRWTVGACMMARRRTHQSPTTKQQALLSLNLTMLEVCGWFFFRRARAFWSRWRFGTPFITCLSPRAVACSIHNSQTEREPSSGMHHTMQQAPHLLSKEHGGGSNKNMVPLMARILAHNPANHDGTRHSITPTVCVAFFGCGWWVSQSLTLLPSCRPSVLSWRAFHSRQQQHQHSLLLSMSVILSSSSPGVRHQQP